MKICSLCLAMTKNNKSKFELEIIERVKAVRTSKGLSQYDISIILGTSSSFIGQVEIPKHSSKYNLNHLNKLAFELNCPLSDFIPTKPIKEDDWE